jgi:hypothetical protein
MTIHRPQAAIGREAEAENKAKALAEVRAKETGVSSAPLQRISGSNSRGLSLVRLRQVAVSFVAMTGNEEEKEKAIENAVAALRGLAPSDELEGMLAAQMILTHNAAMECLARANAERHSFEAREQNLKHAAKLLTVYTRQVEVLDRHRGKGQHDLTVEHVTVNAGGQAIVGHVAGAATGTSAAGAPSANPPRSSPAPDPAPPAAEKKVIKLITKPTR